MDSPDGELRSVFWSKAAAHRLVFLSVVVVLLGCAVFFTGEVSEFLLKRLTFDRHLPDSPSSRGDVVYVLGGTSDSLEAKFRTAAALVRSGKAARVLVASQQTLMGYSPSLGRNLMANEWVEERFAALGVAADVIDYVNLEAGYFGTWSEAETLSRILRHRGFHRLILVTSPYHSRRAWESFSCVIDSPESRLFVYLSNEPTQITSVIAEYLKLLLYRLLLCQEPRK